LLTAYSIAQPVGRCSTKLSLLFRPDVAIEIISDSEAAADSEEKIQQYLAAGAAEVWQIYPRLGLVRSRTHSVAESQLISGSSGVGQPF